MIVALLNLTTYCIGYAGRRNGLKYKHHSQQIRMKYKNQLISHEIVPEALSAAMSNQVYLLRAKNEQRNQTYDSLCFRKG